MAKKYMSQTLFDASVSSIAKSHNSSGLEIDNLIKKLRKYYDHSIIDDGVWDDIAIIVPKVIQFVHNRYAELMKTSKWFSKDRDGFGHDGRTDLEWHTDFFLEGFADSCKTFNSEGKKRSLFFSGMMFMKSEKLPNRKDDCLKRAKEHHKLIYEGD